MVTPLAGIIGRTTKSNERISMMMRSLTLAISVLGALQPLALAAETCDLVRVATHRDADRTEIFSSESGMPALYYRADMDVNTDGAARSYHPDDPRAKTLALNNMGNAISKIYDASGRDITCSPRSGACYSSFISTFEAARAANYAPTGVPRIETSGIIPWKLNPAFGWATPCTISSGPNAGYFVSQTSVVVDSLKDVCEQDRYLDSLTINANVLPLGASWRSQGVITDKTDLVVARDRETGAIAFGLNGDRGPANKIGEGSVAFAAALSKTHLSGTETYAEIRKLARANVDYLIFPTHDVRKILGDSFSQTDIDRIGVETFQKWGGESRLLACSALDR